MDEQADPARILDGHIAARIAELDQELAASAAKQIRQARIGFRCALVVAGWAVALILINLIVRPGIDRWEVIALLAAVGMGALTSAVQYLMIRGCREEIRDLRARSLRR